MATKTDLATFSSVKNSVNGRLRRLKRTPRGWRSSRPDSKSPIAKIGCFDAEIESMEKTLKSMQSRLERAEVKIPD